MGVTLSAPTPFSAWLRTDICRRRDWFCLHLGCLLHAVIQRESTAGRVRVKAIVVKGKSFKLVLLVSTTTGERVHVDCMGTFLRPVMMVFSAQLAEGGGARPPPCTLFTPLLSSSVALSSLSTTKLTMDSYLYSPITPLSHSLCVALYYVH